MGRTALNDVDARISPEQCGAVVIAPTGEGHEVVDRVGRVHGVELEDDLTLGGVEHRPVVVCGVDAHRLRTVEVKRARTALVGCRAARIGRLGSLLQRRERCSADRLRIHRVRVYRVRVYRVRLGFGIDRGQSGIRLDWIETFGRVAVSTVEQPVDTDDNDNDRGDTHSKADHPQPRSCSLLGCLSRGDPAGSVGFLAGAFVGSHGIAGYRVVPLTSARREP